MNLLPVALIFAVVGIVVGIFVFFNPALVIKTQIKFYEKINWRMEPISMPKEIKNTRIMGLVLFAFCVFSIIYIKFFLKLG
jgi:hypothetical protein